MNTRKNDRVWTLQRPEDIRHALVASPKVRVRASMEVITANQDLHFQFLYFHVFAVKLRATTVSGYTYR